MQGLDFFGGDPVGTEDLATTMEWEGMREDDRIVVMSDIWLDKPDTLDRIEVVLEGKQLPKRQKLMKKMFSTKRSQGRGEVNGTGCA